MLQSRPSSDLLSNMDVPSLSHHLVICTHRPHSPRKDFARLMDFVVGRFSRKSSSVTLISWRRETTVRFFS
jgi:hypothetical protein